MVSWILEGRKSAVALMPQPDRQPISTLTCEVQILADFLYSIADPSTSSTLQLLMILWIPKVIRQMVSSRQKTRIVLSTQASK